MPDDRTASAGGRNVLVLSPTADTSDARRWLDRRADEGDGPAGSTVSVTYSQSPDAWLQSRPAGADDRSRRALVRVGGFCRGAAETTSRTGGNGEISVATVSDPADLDALGETLRDLLDGSPAGDGRTLLGFESVTDLLDHVPLDDATDFLRELVALVDRVDGEACYLLDSTAHDSATLASLARLFDAVELAGSGGSVGDAAVPDVDPERVHDVLRSERRRRVLYALLQHPGGMELRSLADLLAASEAEGATTEDVLMALSHMDLPKLVDEGFVERLDDEVLGVTPAAWSLVSYLRLDAAAGDVDPTDLR